MDAVALGTVALAGATAWMAWATHRVSSATRVQAERAHRPVLVPQPSQQKVRVHHEGRSGEGPSFRDGKMHVEVQNIGMGPALNVHGECAAVIGGTTWGVGFVLHPVEGLAAGDAREVAFVPREGDLAVRPELAVRLTYRDVAGRSYWTALHYNASEDAYLCEVGENELPDRLRFKRDNDAIG